ncbi:MAG: phosphonate C-P lyase system protein PhnH [Proteobacteria bacterium]|nr:phosphonate C-P lyase system protein PhnH [Pseudomonadota bacterium]
MSVLAAGFADSSHDSQRMFRAVLDAFSHPGRILSVPVEVETPANLPIATTAFLLTLVDRETPLWLAPAFDKPEIVDFIRFHTSAPIVADPAAAIFALLTPDRAPLLDGFAIGSDPYPDRSATLVIELPALRGGPVHTMRGPGIDGTAPIEIAGLPDGFWSEWTANGVLFPCGVDVVFAAGRELLALPRSTSLEA